MVLGDLFSRGESLLTYGREEKNLQNRLESRKIFAFLVDWFYYGEFTFLQDNAPIGTK